VRKDYFNNVMIDKLIESKYKEGKVIKTFSAFESYLNESEYGSLGTPHRDYDAAEVKRKVGQAVLWLSINRGFYGELLTYLNVYGSATVKTMCTNGKDIVFGPHFVLEHTVKQLAFVLAHEILHCIGDHQGRRDNRDPRKWNIAADYAINPILMGDEVLEIPKGKDGKFSGLYDERFVGMRAEEIYDILEEEGKLKKMTEDPEVQKQVSEMGEVADDDEDFGDPEEDTVVQDPNMDDDGDYEEGDGEDGDESEEDVNGDNETKGNGGEDNGEDGDESEEDVNGDNETKGNGGEDNGEDGDESEGDGDGDGDNDSVNIGDYVETYDGGYGKVTGINPDGTFDITEVTKEEALGSINI
jgi:Putative metallopeptidase domain